MRKLTFTLAIATCALVVSSCQDVTQPEAVDPRTTIMSVTGLVIPTSSNAATTRPSFSSSGSGDTPCVGILPPGTYDNIIVPPNEVCEIQNSVVQGNIKALENSALSVFGGTTVRGSIQGDKAFVVEVLSPPPANRNIVLGNIEIKEGSAGAVCGTMLTNGNIQVEKMRSLVLVGGNRCGVGFGGGNTLEKGNIKVEDNVVVLAQFEIGQNLVSLGNLQVFKNRGVGGKTVQGNTVGQNLQCFENDPPFVGGPNTAGKAEGQCF